MLLPEGLSIEDIKYSLQLLYDTLHTVNKALVEAIDMRLEELLRPNSFPDFISNVVVRAIAQSQEQGGGKWTYNRKHDGFPDLIERGRYPNDSVHHGEGIEVLSLIHI